MQRFGGAPCPRHRAARANSEALRQCRRRWRLLRSGCSSRATHPLRVVFSFVLPPGLDALTWGSFMFFRGFAGRSSAFLPPPYHPITMVYHPILPAGIYKKAPDMVYLSHKSIAGCPAPRGGRENRKAGENPARDRRRKGRVPAQKVTASAGRRADTVTPEPEDLPGRPYCRRSGRSHAVGRTKRYAGMTETALDGFVFLRPFRVFWKGALFL